MKKYTYQDHFEMVYLRHEYAKRCEELNGEYVKEFKNIITTTAKLMYDKLWPNFNKVSIYEEDIAAIASMYVCYYMDLYSLRNNPERKARYITKYRSKNQIEPTTAIIDNYDRNSMITFLRQRIQHVSTLCARKARNVTVGVDKRAAYAYTKETTPVSNELILEDHKKYGYRKVTQAELKQVKKVAKENKSQELVDSNGFQIIEIEILNEGISIHDYFLLVNDNNNNEYNRNPEELITNFEQESLISKYRERFNNSKKSHQRKQLLDFINQNKNNKHLKQELVAARKLLLSKEIVV